MKKELEQIKQDLYHERITAGEIYCAISEVILDKAKDMKCVKCNFGGDKYEMIKHYEIGRKEGTPNIPTKSAVPSEEIKKISTKYELTNGNIKIQVKVSNKGLTITNKQGNRDFRFEFSKPETVKAIGELLIKASEL